MTKIMNGAAAASWFEGTIKYREMFVAQQWCDLDRLMHVDIFNIRLHFLAVVSQPFEGTWHGIINDLEQSATDQALILNEGDIGFHSRGVTIHHKSDGP